MIAFLVPILARWGVKESLQRPLAWLTAAFAVVTLTMALAGAFNTWLHFHDKRVVAADRADALAELVELQAEAEAAAARSRVKDVVEIHKQQEAYRNAIEDPEPGDSADPAVRLGCERLRRSGQDTSGIPACSGR